MQTPEPATPTPAGGGRGARFASAGRATLELALRIGGIFIAVGVVWLVFSLLEPAFFSIDLLFTVLRAMSSVAIVALGLTLVIVVGEIDLSIGATYGLVANTVAVLWLFDGIPVYLSIVLGLLVAVVIGLFNGLLVTMLKIPAFIVTLGTFSLLYGFSLYITNSTTLNPTYPPPGTSVPKSELDFFTGLSQQISIGGHQLSLEIFWMLGIGLVVAFLLHRSLFGFRLTAIGGNAAAARLARLPVRRYKVIAFVLCALLAGIAGILDFSYASSIQPDAGLLPLTFPVFAAVIIGGASLAGGKGTAIGTLGGALLLAALQVGISLLSLGAYANQLFLGIVTICAVALDLGAQRLQARSA